MSTIDPDRPAPDDEPDESDSPADERWRIIVRICRTGDTAMATPQDAATMPATRRSRSPSLVHQPHEARTRFRPGSSRPITPCSERRATTSVASPGGRKETSVE